MWVGEQKSLVINNIKVWELFWSKKFEGAKYDGTCHELWEYNSRI